MIARKKWSLAKYSYFEELNKEGKLEAAERELMEVEDASAAQWRVELKQHMHLLAGGRRTCLLCKMGTNGNRASSRVSLRPNYTLYILERGATVPHHWNTDLP